MFFLILACIIFLNCIEFYWDDENVDMGFIGRTWIIFTSVFTAAYTLWFWKSESAKGIFIIDDLKEVERKIKPSEKSKKIVSTSTWVQGNIYFSILILIVANVIINLVNIDTNYFDLISIIAMILSFSIFVYIDKLIYDNHPEEKTRVIFKFAKDNSDLPGLVAFGILGIYYLYLSLSGNPSPLFFNGSIAFSMLFSSVVWANTDITDEDEDNENNTKTKEEENGTLRLQREDAESPSGF